MEFDYVRCDKSNIYLSGATCNFIKVHDRSEGVVNICPSVGDGHRGITLDNCLATAKKKNANAINWLNGRCYYKKCEDVNDFKIGKYKSGYDVYTLPCAGGEDPHSL